MLQIHTDKKCEENPYFWENFRVKSSVGTNASDTGESILHLFNKELDIHID